MKKKTLILVSELWQVDTLSDAPEGTVIALDLEIEEALAARGVPYISARDYRTPNLDFRDAAHEWAKQVLENLEHPFVEYRGVSLGRVYFYPLYLYFVRLAYWLDIIATLLEQNPDAKKLVVYQSAFRVVETTGDLAQEEINALVDSAKLLGEQKRITVLVSPAPRSVIRGPSVVFNFKRMLFGLLLGVWNRFMHVRKPRSLRILVSDYWRNVGPFMPYLPEAELILIDRLQAFQAGAANMWKWRMRFYHLDAFAGRKEEILWRTEDPQFEARFRGYDISSLLSGAYATLKDSYVPRALCEIDHAYAMLEQLRPHVIILRISTSPQTHYPILAFVGRALNIPSIEFQHGLEYNGDDSFTKRKNAHYLGAYGSLIAGELATTGVAQERIEVVGSPRFDVYAQVHKNKLAFPHSGADFNVLCVYPDLSYGDGFDTYDIDYYMQSIAHSLRGIPNVRLIIKLRGSRREAFSRRRIAQVCGDIPYTIEKDIPLSELLAQSDMMVSCYSTAIIEAMQSGVSVVMYAAIPLEQRIARAHFGRYLRSRALGVAHTQQELMSLVRELADTEVRYAQVARADHFLAENYAFDGQSATRAAEFIRKLARGQ